MWKHAECVVPAQSEKNPGGISSLALEKGEKEKKGKKEKGEKGPIREKSRGNLEPRNRVKTDCMLPTAARFDWNIDLIFYGT